MGNCGLQKLGRDIRSESAREVETDPVRETCHSINDKDAHWCAPSQASACLPEPTKRLQYYYAMAEPGQDLQRPNEIRRVAMGNEESGNEESDDDESTITVTLKTEDDVRPAELQLPDPLGPQLILALGASGVGFGIPASSLRCSQDAAFKLLSAALISTTIQPWRCSNSASL